MCKCTGELVRTVPVLSEPTCNSIPRGGHRFREEVGGRHTRLHQKFCYTVKRSAPGKRSSTHLQSQLLWRQSLGGLWFDASLGKKLKRPQSQQKKLAWWCASIIPAKRCRMILVQANLNKNMRCYLKSNKAKRTRAVAPGMRVPA
jgi:hypothetical protein